MSEGQREISLGQWDDHPDSYGADDHGKCPSCKKPYLRKKQNEHTDTFYHERGSCDLIKPGHVDGFLARLKARAQDIDMSKPFIVPQKKPGAGEPY